jgi:hypothetical protein
MDEFSPASLSTESATESDTDLEDDDRRPTTGYRVVLRVLNGCTHGVACVLLVAIMAGFLRDMGGTWYRIMRYVFLSCGSRGRAHLGCEGEMQVRGESWTN